MAEPPHTDPARHGPPREGSAFGFPLRHPDGPALVPGHANGPGGLRHVTELEPVAPPPPLPGIAPTGNGYPLVTHHAGFPLATQTEIPSGHHVDFSYEVREIMSKAPHWLLRSGSTIIAFAIGILLFVTWLIRYPDTISGTMEITGSNPAVEVVARQNGHLETLAVAEGDQVEKGQLLAVVESTVQSARVFELRERLGVLVPFLSDSSRFELIEIEPQEQLGPLQAAYSQFLSDYIALREIFGDDYSERTAKLLTSQANEQREKIANIEEQIAKADRGVEMARDRYGKMKTLLEKGFLSVAEMEEQEANVLASEASRAEVARALNEERVSTIELEKQISDLRHQREVVVREGVTKLRESLKQLLSGMDLWEETYVLRSPVKGRVAFLDFWSQTQYVTNGRQVFVVAPESDSLMGRMEVKGRSVGKIRPGQVVQLRFADYDYKEYGIATGTVRQVSLVSRKDGGNVVVVDLPNPLTTNFKREIPFKQSMQAEASIVSENLRLIERIFYELRRAFVNAAGKGGSQPDGGGASGGTGRI